MAINFIKKLEEKSLRKLIKTVFIILIISICITTLISIIEYFYLESYEIYLDDVTIMFLNIYALT
jgi:hypothetical protein